MSARRTSMVSMKRKPASIMVMARLISSAGGPARRRAGVDRVDGVADDDGRQHDDDGGADHEDEAEQVAPLVARKVVEQAVASQGESLTELNAERLRLRGGGSRSDGAAGRSSYVSLSGAVVHPGLPRRQWVSLRTVRPEL